MELILGIDLGTTNSAVAFIQNGKPKIIPIGNESILPSCVGINAEGVPIVGRSARNQIISDPEKTISSIKRKMGQNIKVKLGEKEFSPEEISALILRELVKYAEKELGQKVEKAVITVPAYFNEEQRKATRDAGLLAGLDVVRIIHEPTAAAIAYDANHSENEKILVYDLGGGTFDASLVVVENGIVEVKASHGDTHLGGDDFDQLLVEHIIQVFKKQHEIDLSNDFKVKRRLEFVLEKAKCHLSDHPFVRVREEYIWNDLHLDVEISRTEYQEMIRPLLDKTLVSVQNCLRDSKLLPSDLNKVMLVGGSSRTPLVHSLLEEKLGIVPRFEIDPELVVALGASIQAGVLGGIKTDSILVDITPHAFGTSAAGLYQGEPRTDIYVPIIPRNTPIPTRKSEIFYTMVDEQEEVQVEIFEGEAPLAGQNLLLGEFRVTGLSKVPAGNPIVLNLDLDSNGMLQVTAEEKITSLTKTVTLDTKSAKKQLDLDQAQKNIATFLGKSDIEAEFESIPSSPDKNEPLLQAKKLRQRAEKLLSSVDLDEEDKSEMQELLQDSKAAIQSEDWPGLRRCNDSLSDMVFYLED